VVCRVLLFILIAATGYGFEPLKIQDNSFLLEEAYNQEQGVWQHIFTYLAGDDANVAAFTQEIPVGGQAHQFSYTLTALESLDDLEVGDAILNYRYQLLGDGNSRLAVSPRVSLIVPIGDSDSGHGTGEWGYELNLPVSVALSDCLVTHWNAGLTDTRSPLDDLAFFAGGSVIAALTEKFHLMLETRWTDDGESEVTFSPGIRWAWDLKNGFQIVPGIAVPISDDSEAIFLYLSLER
jgi:hypothetical protein